MPQRINKWKQVKRSGAFRRKVDKYKNSLRSSKGVDKYFKTVLNRGGAQSATVINLSVRNFGHASCPFDSHPEGTIISCLEPFSTVCMILNILKK